MATLDPVLDSKSNTYKVPIFRKGEFYVIWTGNGSVRYFTQDKLPDFVKVRLGIIYNSVHANELNHKEMSDQDLSKGALQKDLFESKLFGPEYDDLGWQYNKYYYVVIMDKEELASLKGQGAAKLEKLATA